MPGKDTVGLDFIDNFLVVGSDPMEPLDNMIDRITIEQIGGLTAFDRAIASPGISVWDGVGKSSLFAALCFPQLVARGASHLSQLLTTSPGPSGTGQLGIRLSYRSAGERYLYGLSVAYDARTAAYHLFSENLQVGDALNIRREASRLTEYVDQKQVCQWEAPPDSFFLSSSPATARHAQIVRARNALANMFFLRPEPRMMMTVVDTSAPLQSDCSNFVGWLFAFLSTNPTAYTHLDNALTRIFGGPVVVKTPVDSMGMRHFRVQLPNGRGELPFHYLADHEKLSFVVAAVCMFNCYAPGTVCVWDNFEQLFIKANAKTCWSCLWDHFSATGQLIGLCPHRHIPAEIGNPKFEWI